VVNATPRPLYPGEKDPVRIVQEAGWVRGPVWTGTENVVPREFDPRTVQPVASRYTDLLSLIPDKDENIFLQQIFNLFQVHPVFFTKFLSGVSQPKQASEH
jgi:hypothetical protein